MWKIIDDDDDDDDRILDKFINVAALSSAPVIGNENAIYNIKNNMHAL